MRISHLLISILFILYSKIYFTLCRLASFTLSIHSHRVFTCSLLECNTILFYFYASAAAVNYSMIIFILWPHVHAMSAFKVIKTDKAENNPVSSYVFFRKIFIESEIEIQFRFPIWGIRWCNFKL